MKKIIVIVPLALIFSCTPQSEEGQKSTGGEAPIPKASVSYQKEIKKIKGEIQQSPHSKLSMEELQDLKSKGIITNKEYEKLALLSE